MRRQNENQTGLLWMMQAVAYSADVEDDDGTCDRRIRCHCYAGDHDAGWLNSSEPKNLIVKEAVDFEVSMRRSNGI